MRALSQIALEIYRLWMEMGVYLIFGFAVAGVLSRFLRSETVARHLGHDTWGAVVKAALFGVPLPLCSCGVIPVGLSLYKRGASRGATTAFLISTPQTGVDSILVTYGMLGPLGPIFAIVRPIAAFLNGLLGGAIVTWFDHRDGHAAARRAEPATQTLTSDTRCASGDCSIPAAAGPAPHATLAQHIAGAFLYAFWEFPREIVKWLLVGIAAAGVVSYLLPADPHLLAGYLGTGLWPMLVMAVIGVPLYICATASVPFVAVLLAHGLTPGAALVFLMTGPATNTASFVLLTRMLGKRTMVVYLASIVLTAFTFGGLLNLYFGATGGAPAVTPAHDHGGMGLLNVLGGVALLATTVAALGRNAAERLRARTSRAEEGATAMATTVRIEVQGMTCPNCARHVRQAAESVAGVESAAVDLKKNLLSVTGAQLDLAAIRAAVAEAGYEPGETTA